MATIRKPNGTARQAATKRITAPVDEALFRAVGAYCKGSGRLLGDVVGSALRLYLKGKDLDFGKLAAGSGEPDSEAAA